METKQLAIYYGIIYKCTNLINGKIYIGQTKNLKNRIKGHKRNMENKINRKFYDAMNKYGFENFKWEIIDSASTKSELDFKEKIYIIKYNSLNLGYNMTSGGDGGNTFGGLSEDRKVEFGGKVSKALKGKKKPDGFSEKLSEVHLGKKMPRFGVEKQRNKLLKGRDKYSSIIKESLAKRTEDQKRAQVEKRMKTMSLKSEEQKKLKIERYIKSRRCPVVCLETGNIFKNKKYASIGVYGDKTRVKWITESIKLGKKYLGYSFKYLEDDTKTI